MNEDDNLSEKTVIVPLAACVFQKQQRSSSNLTGMFVECMYVSRELAQETKETKRVDCQICTTLVPSYFYSKTTPIYAFQQ